MHHINSTDKISTLKYNIYLHYALPPVANRAHGDQLLDDGLGDRLDNWGCMDGLDNRLGHDWSVDHWLGDHRSGVNYWLRYRYGVDDLEEIFSYQLI